MKIKMEELKNSLLLDSKERSFKGFTVDTKKDINNQSFEVLREEANYFHVIDIENVSLFVREDILIESLLTNDIKAIEDGDIYEHGYPEGRLIPSNHLESCNDSFMDSIHNEFNQKIDDILSDYLKS